MKNQAQPRDFRGYGDKQPKANWPNNARVAVSIVVNVEEGAELSLSAGDERNENMYAAGISGDIVDIPDLCMESHYEYGTRAGQASTQASTGSSCPICARPSDFMFTAKTWQYYVCTVPYSL